MLALKCTNVYSWVLYLYSLLLCFSLFIFLPPPPPSCLSFPGCRIEFCWEGRTANHPLLSVQPWRQNLILPGVEQPPPSLVCPALGTELNSARRAEQFLGGQNFFCPFWMWFYPPPRNCFLPFLRKFSLLLDTPL